MVKILYVASEALPYVHTGRLADFVGTLPKALNKDEYDARIIIPRYSCIDPRFRKSFRFISHFYLTLGWRKQYVGITEAQYDETIFYFIDNEYYFSGESPYGEPFHDLEKFAFFSKAVLEVLPIIGFQPDIIHCNDWQTALIPLYLKKIYQKSSFYKYMKTVLTIHSIVYQGRWKKRPLLDVIGLSEDLGSSTELDIGEDVSILKGGIIFADQITTISKMHALNVERPMYGEGLQDDIKNRSENFCGILNGIDFARYNPQTDSHIIKRYSAQDVKSGKNANKLAVQSSSFLIKDSTYFMIGIIFRTMDEKTMLLFLALLEKLIEYSNIQLVIMGNISNKEKLYSLSSRYPTQIYFQNTYSEEFAHKIYASSDLFVSLNYYEPGENSHFISMKYGTIPLLYKYNGVYTLELDEFSTEEQGSAFFYDAYESKAILGNIDKILKIYNQDKEQWLELIQHAMTCMYSWDYTKDEYEKLYTKLLL